MERRTRLIILPELGWSPNLPSDSIKTTRYLINLPTCLLTYKPCYRGKLAILYSNKHIMAIALNTQASERHKVREGKREDRKKNRASCMSLISVQSSSANVIINQYHRSQTWREIIKYVQRAK